MTGADSVSIRKDVSGRFGKPDLVFPPCDSLSRQVVQPMTVAHALRQHGFSANLNMMISTLTFNHDLYWNYSADTSDCRNRYQELAFCTKDVGRAINKTEGFLIMHAKYLTSEYL